MKKSAHEVTESRPLQPSESAVRLAEMGWPIFEVQYRRKIPMYKGWQQTLPDPVAVASYGLSNYGLATGFGSGVAVLDVDGEEGFGSLSSLQEKHGSLPAGPVAKTGKGKHLYLKMPTLGDMTLSNKVKFLPGLDVRGEGAFVVVPPSTYENGNKYEWEVAPWDIPLPPVPDWLIEAILGSGKPRQVGRTQKRSEDLTPVLTPSGRTSTGASLKTILVGCAFMAHVAQDAALLPENEWYAALSIIGRCDDGRDLAHEISQPYPDYSPAETDAKLQHALDAAGPRTCANIADEIGFPGCQRCPFRHTIKSPITLGCRPIQQVEIQSRFVHNAATDQFLDVLEGDLLTAKAFGAEVRARMGRNPVDTLLGSFETAVVRFFDYLPGDGRLIIQDGDGPFVGNTWRKGGVIPAVGGDPSVLLSHFDFLFPDPVSRDHVLSYMAHLLQRPSVKIHHVAVITGPEGTGKSTLGVLLKRILGDHNAHKVGGRELSSRFKDGVINRQAIIVEEANHGERFEVVEDIKDLITAEKISVEGKGVAFHEGRTPRGVMLFSNHEAPLVIAKGGRRFFVAATVETKAEPAYYRALYDEVADDVAVAAFAQVLMERDLTGFHAHAEPPMTAARERAETASLTPTAQLVATMIEGATGRFANDLVSITDVLNALQSSRWPSAATLTPNKIVAALKALGARQVNGGCDLRISGGKVRLWAIRNVEKWASAGLDALRGEYTGLTPPDATNVHPFRGPLGEAMARTASGTCMS